MHGLSNDVLGRIVARLALWDARAVQQASPAFAAVVHGVVAGVVRASLESARPRFIDKFLTSPPAFRQVVHGNFVGMRSPRDASLYWSAGGVCVDLFSVDHFRTRGRLRVSVKDLAVWPTLETARDTFTAMRWLAQAAHLASGVRLRAYVHAEVHRPVSEVLNSLAHTFAERHLQDHVLLCGGGHHVATA